MSPPRRILYGKTPLRDISEILVEIMALESDTPSALQSLISE